MTRRCVCRVMAIVIAMAALLALGTGGAELLASGQTFPSRSMEPFGASAGPQSPSWPSRSPQLPGRMPTGGGSSNASKPSGQAVMIRVEVTISDQVGEAAPTRKTVMMLAQDDNRAIIRSENHLKTPERGASGPSLNVEARPTLVAGGKIHLELSVLYDLPDAAAAGTSKPDEPLYTTRLQEGFGLLLENDRPIVISQSADPRVNRKVTVEVKATVLR